MSNGQVSDLDVVGRDGDPCSAVILSLEDGPEAVGAANQEPRRLDRDVLVVVARLDEDPRARTRVVHRCLDRPVVPRDDDDSLPRPVDSRMSHHDQAPHPGLWPTVVATVIVEDPHVGERHRERVAGLDVARVEQPRVRRHRVHPESGRGPRDAVAWLDVHDLRIEVVVTRGDVDGRGRRRGRRDDHHRHRQGDDRDRDARAGPPTHGRPASTSASGACAATGTSRASPGR